jgi:plastocyanin
MLVSDGSPASAAKRVTVQAGGGAAGIAVELFRPDNVVVNVGDTVDFSNPYEEPHTVTYIKNESDIPPGLEGFEAVIGTGAGFDGSKTVSTGFLNKGQTFSVTFVSGGAFKFLCLLHAGMEVDVSVVGAGIYTPPVDAAAAEATLKQGIAIGEAASAAVKPPAPVKNANGTTTYTVPTGPEVPFQGATVDVMRFLPARIEIAPGDTVVWKNDFFVPHTITFLAGPPPSDFDPFELTKPSQNFDPTKLFNGLISTFPGFGGNTTFSLTFPKEGTYNYVCILHADQGMAGVITVGKPSGAITPPSTGDAGLMGHSSGAWMMYTGIALLVASALAAGGLTFARRTE